MKHFLEKVVPFQFCFTYHFLTQRRKRIIYTVIDYQIILILLESLHLSLVFRTNINLRPSTKIWKSKNTYKGSLLSHSVPLKGLKLMALPDFAVFDDEAGDLLFGELWLDLIWLEFWLLLFASLGVVLFLLGLDPPSAPECWGSSSSDMVSSVSRLSLRCFLFLAPGPLVKFAPIGGGGGGGSAPPGGVGGMPAGLSCTKLRLLEGNWPSRLSWSTISLPAIFKKIGKLVNIFYYRRNQLKIYFFFSILNLDEHFSYPCSGALQGQPAQLFACHPVFAIVLATAVSVPLV